MKGKHAFFKPKNGMRVIAHRGFVPPGSNFAENTAEAFAAATALGVEILETDCQLTKDGEVVLFHDADLTRVTGEDIAVRELGLNDLRARFSDLGEIMTLEEALTSFSEARFNVDVKVLAAAEKAGAIIAPHADRVLLTSFSERVRLTALAAATSPGFAGVMTTGPATSPSRAGIVRLLVSLAARRNAAPLLERYDALQIPERQGAIKVLTQRLIKAAHASGVEVHVWTVNDPLQMIKLREMGVDAIITDRVDLALD